MAQVRLRSFSKLFPIQFIETEPVTKTLEVYVVNIPPVLKSQYVQIEETTERSQFQSLHPLILDLAKAILLD